MIGRAAFGADMVMPGMLWGKVLRSPHAHARIKSIDTSKAAALPGVKAVVTSADFPEIPSEEAFVGEGPMNFRDLSYNCMARGKVLYDGHAVAAVAATSPAIAEEALDLIEVEYEVLPHVIDVEDAMKPNAPVLHDDLFTQGVDPKPTKAVQRRQAHHLHQGRFRGRAGRRPRSRSSAAIRASRCIRPISSRMPASSSVGADGQCTIFSSSQGQFMVRAYCAKLLGIDIANIRAMPAEIGGGFGGKTLVYLEPVALALSKKSGRPVKIVMSREEVFRGTGPAAGGVYEVKLGAKKDGRIVAAELVVKLQAGAFPGSPVGPACMCGFAMYDIPHVNIVGYDVVSNRPKVAAYRAPGAPNSTFGTESCMDELARKLEHRSAAAARDQRRQGRHQGGARADLGQYRLSADARGGEGSRRTCKAKLGPNQGRGIASGFWFNIGGESSAAWCTSTRTAPPTVVEGNPDIGGSRASMAMMAAEVLGIPYEQVRPVVADTGSVGFSFLTGGSRVTFATGMAVTQAAEKVVVELKKRAATIWDISPEAVEWKDGKAYPAGPNAGSFEPLSIAEIALKAGRTGGPISAEVSINAQGAGAGLATHICDVEVDRETGYVKILRYTAVQDVGRAIHPRYVEGQIQGGVTQGIGWALNEEYIYDKDGRLDNPGYLDYRMPVASDLPMIEAVMVEVPNPRHPFGAKASARCRSCRRWRRSPTRSPTRSASACATCRCRRRKLRAALDEQEPPRLAAE